MSFWTLLRIDGDSLNSGQRATEAASNQGGKEPILVPQGRHQLVPRARPLHHGPVGPAARGSTAQRSTTLGQWIEKAKRFWLLQGSSPAGVHLTSPNVAERVSRRQSWPILRHVLPHYSGGSKVRPPGPEAGGGRVSPAASRRRPFSACRQCGSLSPRGRPGERRSAEALLMVQRGP